MIALFEILKWKGPQITFPDWDFGSSSSPGGCPGKTGCVVEWLFLVLNVDSNGRGAL